MGLFEDDDYQKDTIVDEENLIQVTDSQIEIMNQNKEETLGKIIPI